MNQAVPYRTFLAIAQYRLPRFLYAAMPLLLLSCGQPQADRQAQEPAYQKSSLGLFPARAVAYDKGAFTEVKPGIGLTQSSCGDKRMALGTARDIGNMPKKIATLSRGHISLTKHEFYGSPISGVCFSPGCAQVVSIGPYRAYRSTGESYLSDDCLVTVERFGSPGNYVFKDFKVNILDGMAMAPEKWHCLFSPDDKLVLLSTASGGGKFSFVIHNMVSKTDIVRETNISCQAGQVSAEVLEGNKVKVTVDGGKFTATYAIR